eukprot:g7531.t1
MAATECFDVCGTGIRLLTSRFMGGSLSREDSTRSTLVDEKSKWIDTAEARSTRGKFHKPSCVGACLYLARLLKDDYQLASKVLGSGMSGPVQLATDRDGEKCAVKSFKKHGLSEKRRGDLKNEYPGWHWTFSLDDVSLRYRSLGVGRPLVFLPAWCQPADLYVECIAPLAAAGYRCITLDHRGHGKSQAPGFGYRLSRLAKDLQELLEDLDLKDVILAGHSMGCAVIWTYLDLFGQSNVSSLVLVDQMAVGTVCPSWSEEQKACYGASATGDAVMQLVSSIADEAEDPRATFLEDMFSEDGCGYWMDYPASRKQKAVMDALQVPREAAAALVLSTLTGDFREVLPRIRVPTLCVGAEESHTCFHRLTSQAATQSVTSVTKVGQPSPGRSPRGMKWWRRTPRRFSPSAWVMGVHEQNMVTGVCRSFQAQRPDILTQPVRLGGCAFLQLQAPLVDSKALTAEIESVALELRNLIAGVDTEHLGTGMVKSAEVRKDDDEEEGQALHAKLLRYRYVRKIEAPPPPLEPLENSYLKAPREVDKMDMNLQKIGWKRDALVRAQHWNKETFDRITTARFRRAEESERVEASLTRQMAMKEKVPQRVEAFRSAQVERLKAKALLREEKLEKVKRKRQEEK